MIKKIWLQKSLSAAAVCERTLTRVLRVCVWERRRFLKVYFVYEVVPQIPVLNDRTAMRENRFLNRSRVYTSIFFSPGFFLGRERHQKCCVPLSARHFLGSDIPVCARIFFDNNLLFHHDIFKNSQVLIFNSRFKLLSWMEIV